MNSTTISNYDVLVDPPMPGVTSEYSLETHKNHVGNKRLQVFLDLYQQAYSGAFERGDLNACNNLVDKIVDTVCNQCVPNGRFLWMSSTTMGNTLKNWTPMEVNNAKALLHNKMQPHNFTTASKTRPILPLETPNSVPPPPPPVPSQMSSPGPRDDGQKRRRRSSLLRRSASEGMLGMVLDNKKKANCAPEEVKSHEEPASWKSARSAGQGITPVSRMDVILTPELNALDPNSQGVGNNRLHILLAMKSANYGKAPVDEREAIVDEVLQIVNTFWKGRFLYDGPNGYEELGKDDARNSLRAIFDLRTGQSSIPPQARYKRHSDPLGGMNNFGIGGAINLGGSTRPGLATLPEPDPLPTKPAIPSRSVFAKSKQASTSMLPSGTNLDLPDVASLREMAVKGLQKQKARQNVANRLQKLTARHSDTPEDGNDQAKPVERFPAFPLGGQMQPNSLKMPAAPPRRGSTVLGKLDAGVMAQITAGFVDEDSDDPLPPTSSNLFGNQFSANRTNGSFPGPNQFPGNNGFL